MIGQKEMLDIILTEAIEADADARRQERRLQPSDPNEPTIQMDLRLVRHPDGTLEWKD